MWNQFQWCAVHWAQHFQVCVWVRWLFHILSFPNLLLTSQLYFLEQVILKFQSCSHTMLYRLLCAPVLVCTGCLGWCGGSAGGCATLHSHLFCLLETHPDIKVCVAMPLFHVFVLERWQTSQIRKQSLIDLLISVLWSTYQCLPVHSYCIHTDYISSVYYYRSLFYCAFIRTYLYYILDGTSSRDYPKIAYRWNLSVTQLAVFP